jgi:hypothetical protein
MIDTPENRRRLAAEIAGKPLAKQHSWHREPPKGLERMVADGDIPAPPVASTTTSTAIKKLPTIVVIIGYILISPLIVIGAVLMTAIYIVVLIGSILWALGEMSNGGGSRRSSGFGISIPLPGPFRWGKSL